MNSAPNKQLEDITPDSAEGISTGIAVLIVIIAIASLIVGIWGGVHAIKNNREALGICAIVLTFLIPPVGVILGIVGFVLKSDSPSKMLDLITKNQ